VPKTFSLKNLVALSETIKEQIVMPADPPHDLCAAILSSGFCHNTTTVSPPVRRAKGVRPFVSISSFRLIFLLYPHVK
jgi:hypothetical protein